VFANSQDGIMITDRSKHILDVNPTFSRLTGYSREEALGRTPRLLSSGRHDATFYAEIWQSVTQKDFWRGEIWNRRKNGEIYPEMLSISAVRDEQGEIQNYLGVFSDISEFKSHQAELERIAHFDTLTGLPNRRLLGDRMQLALSRARRTGKLLAVCYLDLDGFKPINDQHGHEAGDKVLVTVSRNLQTTLRGEDTLARLGGDEFVLLLGDLAGHEECRHMLHRILDAVARPISLGNLMVGVSASVGVTFYPDEEVDGDTLLRHADHAMYIAKRQGKNRYHLFSQTGEQ
jgi:diguanylate cyclase (GGDEF)-like protein/PAS domain S-box-containing protein